MGHVAAVTAVCALCYRVWCCYKRLSGATRSSRATRAIFYVGVFALAWLRVLYACRSLGIYAIYTPWARATCGCARLLLKQPHHRRQLRT